MESIRPAPAVAAAPPGLRARWRQAYQDIFLTDGGSKRGHRARFVTPPFLLFLTSPIHRALTSGWPAVKVAAVVTGLILFAAGFIGVLFKNTPVLHTNRSPALVAATIAAGAAMVPALGVGWLSGLSIYAISLLLFNFDKRYWLPSLVAVTAVTWVASAAMGKSMSASMGIAAETLLVGTIQAAFYTQIRDKVALRQARAELARLAVTEERLRIARDLHDLLGQRLSAVSLKAEVAARLVRRDPTRAAVEMGEVASVARDALSDVRATLSGYRTISLNGEIETATTLLTAAGIAVRTAIEPLPAEADECAGWLVREAATNVIRHASASNCVIRVVSTETAATVEVSDDGAGRGTGVPPDFGNGLTGLSERMTAIGGTLSVCREDGWFVVRATFPATVTAASPVPLEAG